VKTTDIILIGAVALGALYFKGEILAVFDGGGENGASTDTLSPPTPYTPSVPYYWKPSQEYYPPFVYDTPLPVIPSEPDVSSGIPTGSPIPLCPTLARQPRYPLDTQECCQCPSYNIQCGNPESMEKLMLGYAPEDIAWRGRFCGL